MRRVQIFVRIRFYYVNNKMSWNTEDEDCFKAAQLDAKRTPPTCNPGSKNGAFCVQKGTIRQRAGDVCTPGTYCIVDGKSVLCPPLMTGHTESRCPGKVPYICENTPTTEQQCTGPVPEVGDPYIGHEGGEYVWCKRDDPGKFNCGNPPDYCGPHGICTENGCQCMPNFVPDRTTGKCVLGTGLTPGKLCGRSNCPKGFVCTIPQDIHGNIDIDRSALGYSCRYNAGDFCCPHYDGFPCEASSNSDWSCSKNMALAAGSGTAPYNSEVTWHEDADNVGGPGKCVVPGGNDYLAPTCRSVIKGSSAPPAQTWACDKDTFTCSKISGRSGEYGTLADCNTACAAPPAPRWGCLNPGTGKKTCSQLPVGAKFKPSFPTQDACIMGTNNCAN